jgi:phosphoribosylformimino-5-aminoimidazole carboxamide ribotide isomerase
MSKIEILPAIDLRDGNVVRLIQGDYDKQINYDSKPTQMANSFVAAGAKWIHVVDLDGAKGGEVYNFDVLKQILQTGNVNIEVGGGIRSEEIIRKLLDAGATRVIIGTRGIEDWDWFKSIVFTPEFAGKIVLGLDAKDGMLASHGWTQVTELRAIDIAAKVSDWPLAAIVYTDIARDGMLTGPNVEQLELMCQATKVPIIASGGIGSVDDVRKLKHLPIAGIIIGRALYEGSVDLKEAISAVQD